MKYQLEPSLAGKIIDFNHFMPFTVFFFSTYCNNRSLGKSLLSRNRNIKKKKKANISFYNDDFPATFKRMKTSLKILFQKIDLLSAQQKLVGLINYQTWDLCSCLISRLISIKLAFNWIGIWMEYGVLINELNFPIEMHRRPLFNPF